MTAVISQAGVLDLTAAYRDGLGAGAVERVRGQPARAPAYDLVDPHAAGPARRAGLVRARPRRRHRPVRAVGGLRRRGRARPGRRPSWSRSTGGPLRRDRRRLAGVGADRALLDGSADLGGRATRWPGEPNCCGAVVLECAAYGALKRHNPAPSVPGDSA